MTPIEQGQRYTVYDNRTDTPVALCATSNDCAKAMGITVASFYTYLTKSRKRWTILKDGLCGDFLEPKTMGQYMMVCRLKKGMRRCELAKLSGVTVGNIASYEHDQSFPLILSAISIADVLGVSLDELIGRKVK